MNKTIYLALYFSAILLLLGKPLLFSQTDKYNDFEKSLKEISAQHSDEPDSTIFIFNQLLNDKEIRQDLVKIGKLHCLLGAEYAYKKKDIAQAMIHWNKGLEMAQQANNCSLEIQSLVVLTLGYYELKQMDKFFRNYETAADLVKNCKESPYTLYINTQLGYNYEAIGNIEKAKKYFAIMDSIMDNHPELGRFEDKIFAYNTMMDFYESRKDFTQFRYYARKAQKIYLNANKQTPSDLIIFLYVSKLHHRMGELDSAIYYAHLPAQHIAKNYVTQDEEIIQRANTILGDLYQEKGDFKKALLYKQKYISYLDSLSKAYKSNVAINRFNEVNNQLKLEKQKRQMERDTMILYIIGISIIAILIITGIIYANLKEIKRLNINLSAQKQEQVLQNEIRTKMFSILSHDIVSPLAALTNMVDIYHEGSFSQEDFKKYTIDLRRNLKAILNTTENILQWSSAQLKGKKPFKQKLNFHEIIDEQFKLQSLAAAKKNIQLVNNVPADFQFFADINQLSLISRNLIDNAIKYSNTSSRIDISASDTEGGYKILIFKDEGIGMDKDKIDILLNPQTNNKRMGTNLGLQMVYDIVKANDGKMTIESEINKGTVFKLYFKDEMTI